MAVKKGLTRQEAVTLEGAVTCYRRVLKMSAEAIRCGASHTLVELTDEDCYLLEQLIKHAEKSLKERSNRGKDKAQPAR
jgi:hypothetical protein